MERIVALLALLGLALFLGVLAWRVPHLDLVIVLVGCLALAAADVALGLFGRKR